MTTVDDKPSGHVRQLLDIEIKHTDREAAEVAAYVDELRDKLADAERGLAVTRARLAELQHARAVLSGAPVPLAARDVLTAQKGALGMRIGDLTVGVRPDAPTDEIEAYASAMREVQAQALHQVRKATDAVRARRSHEARLVADGCANCAQAVQRAGVDSDGPWMHTATGQAACNPADPLSLPAEPLSERPDAHPYASLLGREAVFVLTDGTMLTGAVQATPAGRVLVATGDRMPVDMPIEQIGHARPLGEPDGPPAMVRVPANDWCPSCGDQIQEHDGVWLHARSQRKECGGQDAPGPDRTVPDSAPPVWPTPAPAPAPSVYEDQAVRDAIRDEAHRG